MQDVEVEVRVDLNLSRLLQQEDLDKDFKITVEDGGPKLFLLEDIAGAFYEVYGSFYLSNLLQVLARAHQDKKQTIKIKTNEIFLSPVEAISKQIKNSHWDALTRTLDEKGIIALLEDAKGHQEDTKRLYVSSKDLETFAYFLTVAKKHPYLHLEVIQLPEILGLEAFEALEEKPGLLALKIDQVTMRGAPFVVPGGRFNEMYGWDTYFILLGLLADQKTDLALSLVENFVYEIEHYGAILNANRAYYLSRSQPPLFSSMLLEVLKCFPERKLAKNWLVKPLNCAIKEYLNVWASPARLTDSGLNRYYGESLKEPPEVEEGHFRAIYSKKAKALGYSASKYRALYRCGKIKDADLDRYFIHDRSMRESGHDTTNRLVYQSADLNTVDLNSLLYKVEKDIEEMIRLFFNGAFLDEEGCMQTSEMWKGRADKRASLMMDLMWDSKKGMFFDYNYKTGLKSTFESATTFYPLFANLVQPAIAKELLQKALPLFESLGGLVSTTKDSRGVVDDDHPQRQWDYPFGWAPHQMIFWKGASNYGYKTIARRLVYRWLYLVTQEARDYNGLIAEKYDVVKRSHKLRAEYGNEGLDFTLYPDGGFGWTNASYQVGLDYLSTEEREALETLTPPEWIFKEKNFE